MTNYLLQMQNARHIAIVVKDIEATLDSYCKDFGIERPEIRPAKGFDVTNVHFKGEPSNAACRLTFLNLGKTQLEIIEPNEHDSVWHFGLENSDKAMHHLAFETNTMDEDIKNFAKIGIEPVQYGKYNGGRYCYFDTRELYGFIIELVQNDK